MTRLPSAPCGYTYEPEARRSWRCFDAAQAARILGISERELAELLTDGRIASHSSPGGRRIAEAAIVAYARSIGLAIDPAGPEIDLGPTRAPASAHVVGERADRRRKYTPAEVDQQRTRVAELRAQGLGWRDIAQAVGLSVETARNRHQGGANADQ